VINGLGYTSAQAQLLTIPVYVFAMILTLVFAWWSDRIEQRSPFIMAGYSIASIGFIAELAIPHPNLPGLTYAFLFVVAAGLYAPFICIVCIIGNNLAPSSKRAVGMALLISIGNMGGIAGSNIYIAREAPNYRTGFGTSLAICICGIAAAFVLRTVYARENKRRDVFLEGKTEEEVLAQYSEQELLDLGDRNPYYRYTL
jgi:MFS family permease